MSTVDFTKLGLTKEVPWQLLVFLRPLVVRQKQNFWRTGVLPVSNAGEQISLAAKRRKNAAPGVSRGQKWEADQPQRGERLVLTHTLEAAPFKVSDPNFLDRASRNQIT